MTSNPLTRLDERLAALAALGILDSPAEARFDRITSMASRLLGTPISLIGLVTDDRQWNKSVLGMPEREWPLSESICRYVVDADAPFVVEDLLSDERFADFPAVRNGARFYAGWPLRDGEGHALGALCVLDDSPRQLGEEERQVLESLAQWAQAELNAEVLVRALQDVRSSEARLLALLDEAPAAVLVVGQDEVVDFANSSAVRLFASSAAASLVGTPLPVLLPAVDVRELEGQGRRKDDSATNRRFVRAGRRGDGASFPAELTVSVTGGARSPYIVFVRDLAEEQTSAAELAELRQRSEVAFDALAEGVLVAEPDGRLSFGNLAAAQILQRRRSDLPGARWHDMIHQTYGPDEPCPLVDPLALAGRTISPVEVRRLDDSTLPVEISVRMLHGQTAAAGVVVTLHDLTERLRADRLKTELISAVSHELRTPLTSIRGSLSLLRSGVIDPASEQGARMLEIATASSERLSRLVNDILDLERLQAGKVQLELTRQRASGLLLQAAQAVSGAAVAAGVRVDVLATEERVIADTDRAVQILVNLLGNAIKFSPRGSTTTLSARRAGDRVLLSVADEGRGIPPEDLERIFDRFSQVDGGDSREFEGTGLGLAIAKGLAEQHGGELSATSTLGEGSTFVLALPTALPRQRTLAYCPAESVPDALAQLMALRGWEARAVPAGGLASSRAGAVMLNTDQPSLLDAVRREAAALQLPLLTLSALATGSEHRDVVGPERGDGAVDGSVLLVEDDDDLAVVLRDALTGRGLRVVRVVDEVGAVAAVRRDRPDGVVLDLRLAGGDGFGVVDALRGEDLPPVLVYSVLELDEGERGRLQTGGTAFLPKGRHPVEDVVDEVVRLAGAARSMQAGPEERS